VASLLDGGIAKPLLGKNDLFDELAYVTGSTGLMGTRPNHDRNSW